MPQMSRGRRRARAAAEKMTAVQLPSGKTPAAQAVEDVATVAVGVGLLSFACIGCVGAVFGAFGVGSFIAALISPWTLLVVPVVGYGLWRWQRHRLECRIDPERRRQPRVRSSN